MPRTGSIRLRKLAAYLAWNAICCFLLVSSCLAQEPPLDVPVVGRLPTRDLSAIAIDGWLLFPTLRTYTMYSDNLFQSATRPIASPGVGVTPGLVAVWTNGIHTTTLYGNLDRQVYPDANEVNTLDGRVGFTQRYEALRDLSFTVDANYVRTTWASGLQGSIQTPQPAPTTTVLPNGNTVLPNGTILSPTGQVVGQSTAPVGSLVPLIVNPNDRYTGTFTVEKIFNRGIVTLAGSVNRTEYEGLNLQNSKSRTFTEHASFWLGPVFYAYSDGALSTVAFDQTLTTTTSHRVLGGLGTRQFGLFRASAYFGHQGSDSDASTTGAHVTAGGSVYGGSVTYYPTPRWTLVGAVDVTNNISSSPSATDLAISLPGTVAVQIPITTSSRVASGSLKASYEISQQWFTNWFVSYTRIAYVDTPRLDNSWVFDATLQYDIWRNMSLVWEYRYTNLQSNVALVSQKSNYVVMGATYKF
jgi:hypothetical protein